MKNNQTWISPTHGKLTLEEIPQYIRDYYNRMKQYDTNIRITIGTDSQNFSYTKEVSKCHCCYLRGTWRYIFL